ncbi:hypothetical protein OBJ68_04385, partial [Empedobacter falsenii]
KHRLDFFVSFFHQGKNECKILSVTFFIHYLSIFIIGIHVPFREQSKKLTKKDLSLIFNGQN